LQTEVAAYLARADLTARIPIFIQQAEEEFNDSIRAPQMETKASLSITGEYVAVPADFLEFRSGYLESSPRRPLEYLSGDIQTRVYGSVTNRDASAPCYFSRVGDNFRFAPVPSSTVPATIVYYAKIPALSGTSTNWLLTRAPSIYLWQSIFQALIYIQDDQRAGNANAAYDRALERFKRSADKSRWGGPAMAMRAV
jgi:hypothetical protein